LPPSPLLDRIRKLERILNTDVQYIRDRAIRIALVALFEEVLFDLRERQRNEFEAGR